MKNYPYPIQENQSLKNIGNKDIKINNQNDFLNYFGIDSSRLPEFVYNLAKQFHFESLKQKKVMYEDDIYSLMKMNYDNASVYVLYDNDKYMQIEEEQIQKIVIDKQLYHENNN